MPAWRILVCVIFVIGFSLSVQAESSGVANIRIVVAHVPTLLDSPVEGGDVSTESGHFCVTASVHSNPHRLVPLAVLDEPGTQAITSGAHTCVSALANSQQIAAYRIVPE